MGIVLAGGLLGFCAAVLSLVAFDQSILAALTIWAGSGPVAALVAVAAALWGGTGTPALEPAPLHRPA